MRRQEYGEPYELEVVEEASISGHVLTVGSYLTVQNEDFGPFWTLQGDMWDTNPATPAKFKFEVSGNCLYDAVMSKGIVICEPDDIEIFLEEHKLKNWKFKKNVPCSFMFAKCFATVKEREEYNCELDRIYGAKNFDYLTRKARWLRKDFLDGTTKEDLPEGYKRLFDADSVALPHDIASHIRMIDQDYYIEMVEKEDRWSFYAKYQQILGSRWLFYIDKENY